MNFIFYLKGVEYFKNMIGFCMNILKFSFTNFLHEYSAEKLF
jgi:hypothetical protein